MTLATARINRAKVGAWLQILFGGILAAFFLLFFIAGLSVLEETAADVVVLVFSVGCTVSGVCMVVCGDKTLRLLRECRRYAAVLVDPNVKSVCQLAEILGTNADETTLQLNRMIRRCYVQGLYLNLQTGEIVAPLRVPVSAAAAPQWSPKGAVQAGSGSAVASAQRGRATAVTCAACGGITVLPLHGTGVCDYCGSKIKA